MKGAETMLFHFKMDMSASKHMVAKKQYWKALGIKYGIVK